MNSSSQAVAFDVAHVNGVPRGCYERADLLVTEKAQTTSGYILLWFVIGERWQTTTTCVLYTHSEIVM